MRTATAPITLLCLIAAGLPAHAGQEAIEFITCGQTVQRHTRDGCPVQFYFSGITGQRARFDMSPSDFLSEVTLVDPDGDIVASDGGKPFVGIDEVLTATSPNWSVIADAPRFGFGCNSGVYSLSMMCDAQPLACLPSGSELELESGRFRVEATYVTATGATGAAQSVSMSGSSGYLWFFGPSNAEVLVKVIRACTPPFNHYWFFAAGLTNVKVTITVTDTATGHTKTYVNPLGRQFQPILDTKAFATCP